MAANEEEVVVEKMETAQKDNSLQKLGGEGKMSEKGVARNVKGVKGRRCHISG